jgi:hypothetical protein
MLLFELACPCYLPAQGSFRDNVESDARLRDVARIADADRAHLRRCERVRQVRRFEPSERRACSRMGHQARPGTGDLDMAGRAAMTVMPPSMCGETIVDQ